MFHEYLHHAPPHVADEDRAAPAWTWDRVLGIVALIIFTILLLMSFGY